MIQLYLKYYQYSLSFFLFLSWVCIYPFHFVTSMIDLEKEVQDFVIEIKKIDIPGYPHAFNASIIKWHNCFLMSFRTIPDPLQNFTSYLGVVWLDEEFFPIGLPQILNFRESDSLVPCRAEDARLISVGEHLYMIYSDNKEPNISKGGFRVYVAELCLKDEEFLIKSSECLAEFEGQNPNVREKNWTPFEYNAELFLAYSLVPHQIFIPLLGTGSCITAFNSYSDVDWKWGELRGGTPGLRINENEYLAFFHSSILMTTTCSNKRKITHYFIGAYTFSHQPPFAMTRISPEPIIGKGFYEGTAYKHYWKSVRVVYPCGYVFDDQYIWLSYGRQDHEIWIAKLDKHKLLESLSDVTHYYRD